MKYLLLSLIVLIGIVSCQKEITDEVTGITDSTILPIDTGKLEADIDSVHWVASTYGAAFSTATPLLPRLFNLTGIGSGSRTLTITLTDSGVHTYTLNNTSMNAASLSGGTGTDTLTYTSNQNFDSSISGTVQITVIDTVNKVVSGKFSFKVYNQLDSSSKTISNGTFTNIPYADGNIIPPSNSTDTFHVKINDTLFTPFSITATLIPLTNAITISASDSLVTENVGLTFPSNVVAGTYPFDLSTYVGLYNSATIQNASTGNIQILEHDTSNKRVRGNFNFHASSLINPADSSNFTQGYFSVKYQ